MHLILKGYIKPLVLSKIRLSALKGLLCLGLMFFLNQSTATHLRSVEIRVERVSCSSLTFKIVLTAYINTVSNSNFGAYGYLSFGDGFGINYNRPGGIPEVNRPDLGPNIGVVKDSTYHTYAQVGNYTINYTEGDRNEFLKNIDNADDVDISTYFKITAASMTLCNTYPKLALPPVDRGCSGGIFFHNPAFSDPVDGDSISYELTIPEKGQGVPVDGYFSPASPQFYPPGSFNVSNEAGTGPPSLTIDNITGDIVWDAPGFTGEYVIAFQIREWRNSPLPGVPPTLLSIAIRDMQITVDACANGRPDVTIPSDLCVVAGTVIDEKIFGYDPEDNDVKIEFVSEIFSLSFQPATLNPPPPAEFRPSNPADTVRFHWQTDCQHVRDQAYQVTIKITDSPHFGKPAFSQKTWRIKIIAPTPVWTDVSLDLEARKAILKWEPYSCPNTQYIQIWRKVGHYNYTPGKCNAGLPKNIGYQLVAQLDPSETTFVDDNSTKGLVDGALYCYRIVAAFALPAGGKSYVTTEQCVGPIFTDAPIITNVSVENTHPTEGSILVKWLSPDSIDAVLFPPPYQYHVYRGDGFESETGIAEVGVVENDTSYLDPNINTTDSVYNYRIVIYSKPDGYPEFIKVDTSFAASSVRLNATPGSGVIDLDWLSIVPWSNTIEGSAYHNIYRGPKDAQQLTLLVKVDITENGFEFSDKTVIPSQYYCYRIMTRGSYGNPGDAVLENYSQQVCLYPKNNLLPCTPSLEVSVTDCDEFLAAPVCEGEFENMLAWTITQPSGCRKDVVSYKVYASSNQDGEFALIKDGLTEANYIDAGLSSFARCYRVTSVDTQGKESEQSEPSCNDNCPFFELPNIFTPGLKDGCNDTFRAYNGVTISDPCVGNTGIPCLPFINSVDFKVYNRWGKEVFSSSTQEGLPPTIEWKGVGNNGNELESGIYYYWAEVEFSVIDETRKGKTLKGWVNLVR